jgi:hypothetical protein
MAALRSTTPPCEPPFAQFFNRHFNNAAVTPNIDWKSLTGTFENNLLHRRLQRHLSTFFQRQVEHIGRRLRHNFVQRVKRLS